MPLLGVNAALDALLACLCEGLDAAGQPVCSCAVTVGTPISGPCCECGEDENHEGITGSLWVSFGGLTSLGRGDVRQPATVTPKPCTSVNWGMLVNVTLFRCFPTIDGRDLPTPEDFEDAALRYGNDVAALARAAHCCAAFPEGAVVTSVTALPEPSGGCSGLSMQVTVPVSLAPQRNPPLN